MSSYPPPPESLEEDAAQVWCDTLEAYGAGAAKVAGPLLEEYCQAVAIARRARKRVDDEQIIVGDAKGSPIAHPAIAIERRAMETIRRLEDRFKPPLRRPPRRRSSRSRRPSCATSPATPARWPRP